MNSMNNLETWGRIVKTIIGQVDLANEKKPGRCKITQTQPFVSLVSRHGGTGVFDFDADQRTIGVTFSALVDRGNGRRGKFAITPEQMIEKKEFEFFGTPKPPARPMSPEEFSEIILAPFLDEM
jgi:hypothetical protein